MKKRTKIITIIIAVVLVICTAVTGFFVYTRGSWNKDILNFAGYDKSEWTYKYYDSEDPDDIYPGFDKLSDEEQQDMVFSYANEAAVPLTDFQDEVSEAKELVAAYFKDVVKIDYTEEIEGFDVKVMKLPELNGGCYILGACLEDDEDTVYLDSYYVDGCLNTGNKNAITTTLVHEMTHHLLFTKEYCEEIGLDTDEENDFNLDEDLTEYLTREIMKYSGHESEYDSTTTSYHPDNMAKFVADDPDFAMNCLHEKLTSDEISAIDNYMQNYYAE